jgi:hypothetical protein
MAFGLVLGCVLIALLHHSSPAPHRLGKGSGPIHGGLQAGCFENPETEGTSRFEACGYPGPSNEGEQAATGKTCAELPEVTGATLRAESKPASHELIEGKDIQLGEDTLYLEGEGITFNKDCVVANTQTGASVGNSAIELAEGEKGFTLENSTIHGENQQTKALSASGIWTAEGHATGTTITKDSFYWCVECVQGPATVTKTYLFANGMLGKGTESETLHREDWYVNESSVIAKEDTLLNPEFTVANIFEDSFVHEHTACVDNMTVENSLLAGGFSQFDMCGSKVSEAGTATQIVRNDRFARCLGTPEVNVYAYGNGPAFVLGKGCTTAHSGERCTNSSCTAASESGTYASVYNASWDTHGYFPKGGLSNISGCNSSTEASKCPAGANLAWEGNYWDDNLSTISRGEANE